MPIKETEIFIGATYATPTNQERRVTDIRNGFVQYECRGGNIKNKWHPGTYERPPLIATFANACNRIIDLPDEKLPPLDSPLREKNSKQSTKNKNGIEVVKF